MVETLSTGPVDPATDMLGTVGVGPPGSNGPPVPVLTPPAFRVKDDEGC